MVVGVHCHLHPAEERPTEVSYEDVCGDSSSSFPTDPGLQCFPSPIPAPARLVATGVEWEATPAVTRRQRKREVQAAQKQHSKELRLHLTRHSGHVVRTTLAPGPPWDRRSACPVPSSLANRSSSPNLCSLREAALCCLHALLAQTLLVGETLGVLHWPARSTRVDSNPTRHPATDLIRRSATGR